MLSLSDIQAAAARIAPYVRKTDITHITLPKGGNLNIKLENLQYTGAYKVRGAFNCVLQLSDEQKKAGILAASAGNHAQGVARAARELQMKCTIVMPAGAPLSKVAATERYGANVVLYGELYDDACNYARKLEAETGMTFIHPFDDERVMAGQGTLGLEILEQCENLGMVLVPIGGGGLASGIATAIKSLKKDVRIVGVEPSNAASMSASISAGRIITLPSANTIADGIAVKTPGDNTYPLCRALLDEVVTVDEGDIANAILYLLEKGKIVSEGAGAASVAAVLAGKVTLPEGKETVALLSGGNIDVTMISRIIDKGLLRSGRKVIISTRISDKPGHLVRLLEFISTTGANIVSVSHDRSNAEMNITESSVSIELETRDRRHVFDIRSMLEDAGYQLRS
ncbi:threonine ammonia-lyase [Christensenellaceae bacterium OttesenSCG-928-L17]|nr:threonine ammonia-lyase [Christensenellaceae bacterium OttesenSCG-928-L17]